MRWLPQDGRRSAVVQHRVGRPPRGGGKFAGLDGLHFAARAGELHDLAREAVPRRLAGGHEVQQAARVACDERERPFRQEGARRRYAALVVDHAQPLAGARFGGDRQEEVFAARPVHPARAQDEMPASGCLHGALAGELAAPVDAVRIGCVVLDVGGAFRAVEDIVGRVVHQQGPETLRLRGKHARRDAVDEHREPGLGFGLVDGGVRGRVHDEVRLRLAHHAPHRVLIGEIKLRPASGDELCRRQQACELPAHLAVAASEQHSQSKSCADLDGPPRASFSFSTGSLVNGQRTPRSESAQ